MQGGYEGGQPGEPFQNRSRFPQGPPGDDGFLTNIVSQITMTSMPSEPLIYESVTKIAGNLK